MDKKKQIFNLYKNLSDLSDLRRSQGRRHKIELVIMIVFLAIMNCYDNYHAIDDFIKKNRKELIKSFKPEKDRLPSLATVRRVMMLVDFEELCNIFEKWTKCNIKIENKEWISLDGKAISGTFPEEMHKFVNLVSMFSHKKKMVFSVGKVDKKSNEIPLVQKLIEDFNEENIVYRMDALHCQKKTVKIILKKKSFYVLDVKANQKTLLKKVKFIAGHLPILSSHTSEEKNRGRRETRKVTTYKQHLDLKYYGWNDLKLIVKVERTVRHKTGKISEETAYFITNLEEKASFFNKGIRDHWKIENSLHYVKDVTFNEDRLKIRTGMAPENMSLLRTWIINIFRKNGCTSIIQATRLLAGNISAMLTLLGVHI